MASFAVSHSSMSSQLKATRGVAFAMDIESKYAPVLFAGAVRGGGRTDVGTCFLAGKGMEEGIGKPGAPGW